MVIRLTCFGEKELNLCSHFNRVLSLFCPCSAHVKKTENIFYVSLNILSLGTSLHVLGIRYNTSPITLSKKYVLSRLLPTVHVKKTEEIYIFLLAHCVASKCQCNQILFVHKPNQISGRVGTMPIIFSAAPPPPLLFNYSLYELMGNISL